MSSPAFQTIPFVAPVFRENSLSSVLKAFELLCCFTTQQPEWGVTELADYLGMSKSAVHRILVTCEQFKFVERTTDRRYRIGVRALELGNVYRFDRRMLTGADIALRRLADSTNSLAHLAELDGREIVELMQFSGEHAVRFNSRPILRASAHATATGKVLLANSPQETLDKILGKQRKLKQYTPYTIVDPPTLRLELKEIAAQGWAFSNQESTLGCCCLAVPLRNRVGRVVASISISNTCDVFNSASLAKYLGRLFLTAESIGRDF
jgi:DNA-binding IclR family transcriptional regulator